MREVAIISAVRTPIGTFGGGLKPLDAIQIGTVAAKEAIQRAGIKPEEIEEVVIGNVLQAGLGQNVARQIAVHSEIPYETSAMTINKLCGSGLRTVSLGAQMIMMGDANIILVGGTESMSNAPHIMPTARWGSRMGDLTLEDSLFKDGLVDAFNDYHMGITAENIAEKWEITRDDQDRFALSSQEKAEAAIKNGVFKDEIVPVVIETRKGKTIVDTDEHPRLGVTLEQLGKLRAAFKKEGTVTAGNASGINDGAAMLVLMERTQAEERGLEILGVIKGYGSAGVDPAIMGYGPVPATRKALARAGMSVEEIELVEANEAFAAQSIAVVRDLALDPQIVNVNGGAIALGHPIGASGARILVTLLHEMKHRNAKKGLATLCIGGGQGTAVIVERP